MELVGFTKALRSNGIMTAHFHQLSLAAFSSTISCCFFINYLLLHFHQLSLAAFSSTISCCIFINYLLLLALLNAFL